MEDLPLSRTVALVPEIVVYDLPLGRILRMMMDIYIFQTLYQSVVYKLSLYFGLLFKSLTGTVFSLQWRP